jgi:rhodanese-related sulfurtransferase
MTMAENQGRDPDMAGVLRGAVLIVVIGAALGIAYNAMGLASRPRHGLAWIKQAEKLESLEALQDTPGTAAPTGGTAAAAPGAAASPGAAMTEPAGGDAGTAVAATSRPASTPTPPRPEPAAGTRREPSPPAASGSAGKQPAGASSPAHAATPAPANAGATAGASASVPAPTRASGEGAAPAGAAATAAAPTSVAADLPVIPDVTGPLKLELATLKKLYAANAALVIDAREAPEYADGHISGALSLPYNDAMAEPERVKKLDPAGRPIVIYCSGGDCELSMDLAKVLIEAGKRKVLVYEGGFPEWQGAGMPVAKGPNP